jgi:hypothetical protein
MYLGHRKSTDNVFGETLLVNIPLKLIDHFGNKFPVSHVSEKSLQPPQG